MQMPLRVIVLIGSINTCTHTHATNKPTEIWMSYDNRTHIIIPYTVISVYGGKERKESVIASSITTIKFSIKRCDMCHPLLTERCNHLYCFPWKWSNIFLIISFSPRITLNGMKVSRPDVRIGRYRMIKHERDEHNEPNPQRWALTFYHSTAFRHTAL